MRSQFVFEALQTVNRFQLCRLAAKATRKLHIPGNRVQDTTNDVLRRLVEAEHNTPSKTVAREAVSRVDRRG